MLLAAFEFSARADFINTFTLWSFAMRSLVFALVAFTAVSASAAEKKVDASQNWVAVAKDNSLAAAAPRNGLITDAKAFAKLWKKWRKADKVPMIDFKDHFVLVTLAKGGPNIPRIRASLDDKGNLKILALSTLIGGDGFGYSIATFPRKGIKTVNGVKLP